MGATAGKALGTSNAGGAAHSGLPIWHLSGGRPAVGYTSDSRRTSAGRRLRLTQLVFSLQPSAISVTEMFFTLCACSYDSITYL
jgi:hypothetical protein